MNKHTGARRQGERWVGGQAGAGGQGAEWATACAACAGLQGRCQERVGAQAAQALALFGASQLAQALLVGEQRQRDTAGRHSTPQPRAYPPACLPAHPPCSSGSFMYLRAMRFTMRPPLSPAVCCVKVWASSSSGCSALTRRRCSTYACAEPTGREGFGEGRGGGVQAWHGRRAAAGTVSVPAGVAPGCTGCATLFLTPPSLAMERLPPLWCASSPLHASVAGRQLHSEHKAGTYLHSCTVWDALLPVLTQVEPQVWGGAWQ